MLERYVKKANLFVKKNKIKINIADKKEIFNRDL